MVFYLEKIGTETINSADILSSISLVIASFLGSFFSYLFMQKYNSVKNNIRKKIIKNIMCYVCDENKEVWIQNIRLINLRHDHLKNSLSGNYSNNYKIGLDTFYLFTIENYSSELTDTIIYEKEKALNIKLSVLNRVFNEYNHFWNEAIKSFIHNEKTIKIKELFNLSNEIYKGLSNKDYILPTIYEDLKIFRELINKKTRESVLHKLGFR